MYKLCVFDLDGTLVNTIADIADAANYALRQLGFPECDEDSYRYKIGNGMRMICYRAMPEGNDDKLDEMVRIYNERYCVHCCDRSLPYPGMVELMPRLKAEGVTIAVISNKPHPQTMIVMDKSFRDAGFASIEGQSDRFKKKPDPDALVSCYTSLGFKPEETVYVGDSNVDIEFAKAAGVSSLGVAWGFRGREELEGSGADFIAETADEIFDFVTK